MLIFMKKITKETLGEYIGEFKDDKKQGQGTFTWANGDQYIGEYKDDKYHGQGTSTYANGNLYIGEYKDCLLYTSPSPRD